MIIKYLSAVRNTYLPAYFESVNNSEKGDDYLTDGGNPKDSDFTLDSEGNRRKFTR